jgi:hypothetical protein
MNFRRCAFYYYYYYLIMENIYKINKSNNIHIRKHRYFTSFIVKCDATGKQIFR